VNPAGNVIAGAAVDAAIGGVADAELAGAVVVVDVVVVVVVAVVVVLW